MREEAVYDLYNFSMNERSIPWPDKPDGELIFGEYKALNENFIYNFDDYVSGVKSNWGQAAGQCIVHDFNMRTHYGADHGMGIAVDFHFRGVSLFDTVMSAITWGYRKLFFYPEWNHPGVHLSYCPDLEHIILGIGCYLEEELKIITITHNPQFVYGRLKDLK